MNNPSDLAMYLPEWLRRKLARRPFPPTAPETERMPCAVLFADISGFTPLMEHLGQRGLQGVEELSRTMNGYFDRLLQVVARHGGEVARFAGDAALLPWPARDASDEALTEATRRAAQCGLELQQALHGYPVSEGLTLSLRLGLGRGELQALIVGADPRWEYLVSGGPLRQAAAAQQVASPGELVASPSAWECLRESFDGIERSAGNVRLSSVRSALAPCPAIAPELPPGVEACLRPFVSRTLRALFEVSHSAWRAELRRVTVLFLEIHGLAEPSSPELLGQMQAVTRELQAAVYAFGGSINQLLADDKGTVLLAAWGLPSCSHEDDAVRAVKATLQAQGALKRLGLSASAGITSGRVFCGDRGGAGRREYALLGHVVNLAARLMQSARGDILCDEATARAAGARLWFESLTPVRMKGVAEPVPVLRPVMEQRRPERNMAIVGRQEERALLDEALEQLLAGHGGVFMLEGEAGVGKSSLVRHFLTRARERGPRVLQAAADAVESATLYYAWRPVFAELFSVTLSLSVEARRAVVLARLSGNERLLSLSPLLNPVLLLDLPDTALTSQMQDEARADSTRSLLLELLREALRGRPTVLVLEDAHWFDSASWELLRHFLREQPEHLVLVSSRPALDAENVQLKTLAQLPSTRCLRLQRMPAEDISLLICTRLGALRLAEPLAAFIREKAEGHPFFSEELAYALRDHGLLVTEAGECRFSSRVSGASASMALPSTLEGIITSRVDRLSPDQQLTLKAASVIGRVFTYGVLRGIHPLGEARTDLTADLEQLTHRELTVLVKTLQDDNAYLFKHAITQEVVYNLMLFEQRRKLHEAVARWYERAFADDLTPYHPMLAHHWLNADIKPKAIEMLEKAGEQAFQTNASREAVEFLSKASDLDERSGEPVRKERRARWARMLGTSHMRLGNHREASDLLVRALALLGFSVPRTPRALGLGSLREVLEQLCHRLLPSWLFRVNQARAHELLDAAAICNELALACVWRGELSGIVYYFLRGMNLAERAGGLSGTLTRTWGAMVLLAGMLGLPRAARLYQKLAADSAEQLNEIQNLAHAWRDMSIYLIGTGQFAEARRASARASSGFRQIGSMRLAEESMHMAFNVSFMQGDLEEAERVGQELLKQARQRGDTQLQQWALVTLSRVLLRRGREREVLELLKGHDMMQDALAGVALMGVLARARLQLGQLAEARVVAEKGVEFFLKTHLHPYIADIHAAIADTLIQLWSRTHQGEKDHEHLGRLARQVCALLDTTARRFVVVAPVAHVCRGRLLLVEGRRRAARKSFERALELAHRLGMPFEQREAREALAAVTA